MPRMLPTICIASALLLGAPAFAGMGPCLPDQHDGLICGSGDGAARVIEDTLSPSKRFALAWRSLDAPPTQEPKDDKTELLLVRVGDGVILTRSPTEYWDTGEMHVNRLQEQASWSPNSRLVIRAFQQRFETGSAELYAIGKTGEFAGALDLRKILDTAIRARLKQRRVRDAESYSFSLSSGPELKIGNDGLIRASVMMWIPKEGPEHNYAATLQAMQKPGGGLIARMVSIAPARERR